MTHDVPSHLLGDEDLGSSNHVCGLFQGPAEARAALLPVVIDGLLAGERVVYFAQDPLDVRQALASSLRARDADVPSLERSGALDLRGWNDSYLDHERFSAARMLGVLSAVLRDGKRAGQGGVRLIGEMEWAMDHVPGVDELITYEAGIDAIMGHRADLVICAYDVRQHSASRIAAVAAVHESVFVGGRLQRSSRVAAGTGPRARILTTAGRLFADAGVRATGVDGLIAASGVAKATFYRHFRSKDELIVAWLEDPRTRWFERIRARAEERAESPEDVLPRFFDALAEWLEAGDYRGCPYLNTAIELQDAAHRAVVVVQRYLHEISAGMGEIAAAAGVPDSVRVGTELQVLAAGAITLGAAHRSTAFVLAARRIAAGIVRDAGGGRDS